MRWYRSYRRAATQWRAIISRPSPQPMPLPSATTTPRLIEACTQRSLRCVTTIAVVLMAAAATARAAPVDDLRALVEAGQAADAYAAFCANADLSTRPREFDL